MHDYPHDFPGQYTVEASDTIWDKVLPASVEIGAGHGDGTYDLTVVGSNRFLRHFTGDAKASGTTAKVEMTYYRGASVRNPSSCSC